jgi:hypothetical protein
MALSLTYALQHIKRMLGASHRPLPIGDEEILEIIKMESLYTFSNYYPFQFNITINGSNQVPNEKGVYYLDGQGLEILGVAKVFRSEPTDYGYYGECCYTNQSIMSPVEALNTQMVTDLVSMSQVPNTFNYIAPNRLELFPKNIIEENIIVTVKAVHPEHLATIPMSFREVFLKLCLLDVKITLWNILKQFSDLTTAVGNFNLKIEDYENAQNEREELLELMSTSYMKEANRRKIWIG